MPKIKTRSGKTKRFDYTKLGYKKYTAMKKKLGKKKSG
jgi:ribosomal protein L35